MLERCDNINQITAQDIFTQKPKTIHPDVMAIDALDIFALYDISQLIVESDGQYLGILHLHELIKEGIN
jgi:arabinose-5-phosphate isomerase